MKVAFLFVFVLFSFSFICSFPSFYPIVIFIISALNLIIFKCISSCPIVHTDLWTIHTWNKDHSINDPANDTCTFHFSIDLVWFFYICFIHFIFIDFLHYTIYSVKKKKTKMSVVIKVRPAISKVSMLQFSNFLHI